jgi:hypothetical protein
VLYLCENWQRYSPSGGVSEKSNQEGVTKVTEKVGMVL